MKSGSSEATALLVERVLTLSRRLSLSDARFAQACDHLLLIATHRQPPEHLRPVAQAIGMRPAKSH